MSCVLIFRIFCVSPSFAVPLSLLYSFRFFYSPDSQMAPTPLSLRHVPPSRFFYSSSPFSFKEKESFEVLLHLSFLFPFPSSPITESRSSLRSYQLSQGDLFFFFAIRNSGHQSPPRSSRPCFLFSLLSSLPPPSFLISSHLTHCTLSCLLSCLPVPPFFFYLVPFHPLLISRSPSTSSPSSSSEKVNPTYFDAKRARCCC